MPKDKANTQDVDTLETSNNEDNQEEVSFTEEQQQKVNELISGRLDRADKKWEDKLAKIQEEANRKIAEAKEEGEKMAKLSAKEKEEEVLKKQQKLNEERDKKLSQRENKLEAIELFSEAEIPVDLVDYIVTTDRDETIEKAEKFIENYKSSLEKSVAKQLEGEPPKDMDKKNKSSEKTGLKPAY
jgi:hypothetical protein